MAEDVEEEIETQKKGSKKPFLIGLILAVLAGGSGFYASWSGMILAGSDQEYVSDVPKGPDALPDVAFVPVDPLIIGIQSESGSAHLRFRANLEVPKKYQEDVELILPRVVDVLNGYLRAVDTRDIENPAALSRLRAQMLRRVEIVTGKDRVNDLLVMEFVIN